MKERPDYSPLAIAGVLIAAIFGIVYLATHGQAELAEAIIAGIVFVTVCLTGL